MNSQSYLIKEIRDVEEMVSHYSLLKELYPELTLSVYKKYLQQMKGVYFQIGAFDADNNCVGISGIWVNTKLYCGKYVEMDNVVVAKNERSKGIGKLLSDWVIDYAKKEDCAVVLLDAYLPNNGAHKFYEREGFVKKGFHFIKNLSDSETLGCN